MFAPSVTALDNENIFMIIFVALRLKLPDTSAATVNNVAHGKTRTH